LFNYTPVYFTLFMRWQPRQSEEKEESAMSQAGRPRSLDESKRREVCALISAGCGLDAAARYVSCSVSTIRREALRNDEFRKQLRGAEVHAQLDPLRAMRRAAGTHWRAAAWLLERTIPERFARRRDNACSAHDLHDVVDAIVESAVEEIEDPETRERVCRRLLATAYRTRRALVAEERARLDPRSGTFDMPQSRDERRVNRLVEKIRSGRRQAAAEFDARAQNPASFA
jgi:hypothetical protein